MKASHAHATSLVKLASAPPLRESPLIGPRNGGHDETQSPRSATRASTFDFGFEREPRRAVGYGAITLRAPPARG
jgi:hypothetical protein